MKITSAYLKKWLQNEFTRLEINMIVVEGYATRYQQKEYESGAAFYVFRVKENLTDSNWANVMCFYSRKDIEHLMALGYSLKLVLKHIAGGHYTVNDAQIDLKK